MEQQANDGLKTDGDRFINSRSGNKLESEQNSPVRDNGLNDKLKRLK